MPKFKGKLTESNFKHRLSYNIKKFYPLAYFCKVSDKYHAGIPDCFICNQGKAIWAELKIYPNPTTTIQSHEIEKIRKAGGNAVVLSADPREGVFYIGIKQFDSIRLLLKELFKCQPIS